MKGPARETAAMRLAGIGRVRRPGQMPATGPVPGPGRVKGDGRATGPAPVTGPTAATGPVTLAGNLTWAGAVLRGVAACMGAAMIILPAPGLPRGAFVLPVAGLLLVAASVVSPLAHWRWAATLAAAAAVTEATIVRPHIAVLGGEGLLILGYLLLVDAPAAMRARTAARWLRLQLPAAAWGAVTSAVVLAALAVSVPVSAWLLVAGAGGAVAATVLALPRRTRQPGEPEEPP